MIEKQLEADFEKWWNNAYWLRRVTNIKKSVAHRIFQAGFSAGTDYVIDKWEKANNE